MKKKQFIFLIYVFLFLIGCSVKDNSDTQTQQMITVPTAAGVNPTEAITNTPIPEEGKEPSLEEVLFGATKVYWYPAEGGVVDCGKCYEVEYNTGEIEKYNPRKNESDYEPSQRLELTWGEEKMQFQYSVNQYSAYEEKQVYHYQDKKYMARMRYVDDGDNVTLLGIALGDYEHYIFEGVFVSEDELLSACKRQCQQLQVPIDEYVPTVTTIAYYNTGHGGWQEQYDGFKVVDDENVYKVSYEVKYRRYIGNIPTQDIRWMKVSAEGQLISMTFLGIYSFSPEHGTTSIDQKAINELVDDTIKTMCDIEEYEFTGYSTQQSLIVLNGELVMECYVKPEFASEESDHVHTKPIYLLVPIETAN